MKKSAVPETPARALGGPVDGHREGALRCDREPVEGLRLLPPVLECERGHVRRTHPARKAPGKTDDAIRLRIGGCGKRDAGCVDTLLFLVKERG